MLRPIPLLLIILVVVAVLGSRARTPPPDIERIVVGRWSIAGSPPGVSVVLRPDHTGGYETPAGPIHYVDLFRWSAEGGALCMTRGSDALRLGVAASADEDTLMLTIPEGTVQHWYRLSH